MSLDVSAVVEKIVRERAAAEGVTVEELLKRSFGDRRPSNAPAEAVRSLLGRWQAADSASAANPPGESGRTLAASELFDTWRQIDAAMTSEEREAEDRLWEDVVRGIDDSRVLLGMRPLFG